jgi:hypothetical protein
VDAVAEFVEEGYHFVVFEEGGLGGGWFGEVADEGGGGVAACAVRVEVAGLEGEVGGVAVFAWTRVEIKVEIANESSTFSLVIPYTKDLYIFVPSNISPFTSTCNRLDENFKT